LILSTSRLLFLSLIFFCSDVLAGQSMRFGKVNNGRIRDATSLPAKGQNFSSYSLLGHKLGRTYVHSAVAKIVVSAFKEFEVTAPSKVFIYGETGLASGGKFKPHRTHQRYCQVNQAKYMTGHELVKTLVFPPSISC
jgi:penicillin-insensitive murein DD-endopeptidase